MLVLVLGACGSAKEIVADSIVADSKEQLLPQLLNAQQQSKRLERQVEALMLEVQWLHNCVRNESYPCVGQLVTGGKRYWSVSPFRSTEAFKEWEKKDYP